MIHRKKKATRASIAANAAAALGDGRTTLPRRSIIARRNTMRYRSAAMLENAEIELMQADEHDVKAAFEAIDRRCLQERTSMDQEWQLISAVWIELHRREIEEQLKAEREREAAERNKMDLIERESQSYETDLDAEQQCEASERRRMDIIESEQRDLEEMVRGFQFSSRKCVALMMSRDRGFVNDAFKRWMSCSRAVAVERMEERKEMARMEKEQRTYEETLRREKAARELVEKSLRAAELRQMNAEENALRHVFQELKAMREREVSEMKGNESFQYDVFDVLSRLAEGERALMSSDEDSTRLAYEAIARHALNECSHMATEDDCSRNANDAWKLARQSVSFSIEKCAALLLSRERARTNDAFKLWSLFSCAVGEARLAEAEHMATEERQRRNFLELVAEMEANERERMHADEDVTRTVFRTLDNRRRSERGRMSRDEDHTQMVWAVLEQRLARETATFAKEDAASMVALNTESRRETAERRLMKAEELLSSSVESAAVGKIRAERQGFVAEDALSQAWEQLVRREAESAVAEKRAMEAEEVKGAALESQHQREVHEREDMALEEARCREVIQHTAAALQGQLIKLQKMKSKQEHRRRSVVGDGLPSLERMAADIESHFPSSEANRAFTMERAINELAKRSKPLSPDAHLEIDGVSHRPEDMEEELKSLQAVAAVMRAHLEVATVERDKARREKAKIVPEFHALKQYCERQRASTEGTSGKTADLLAGLREGLPGTIEDRIRKSQDNHWLSKLAEFKREKQLKLDDAAAKIRLEAADAEGGFEKGNTDAVGEILLRMQAQLKRVAAETEVCREKAAEVEATKTRIATALAEALARREKRKPNRAEQTETMNRVSALWKTQETPMGEIRAFLKSVEGRPVFANTAVCEAYHNKSTQLQQKLSIAQMARRVDTTRSQLDLVATILQSPQLSTSNRVVASLKAQGLKIDPGLENNPEKMISHLSSFRIVAAADFTHSNRELKEAVYYYRKQWGDIDASTSFLTAADDIMPEEKKGFHFEGYHHDHDRDGRDTPSPTPSPPRSPPPPPRSPGMLKDSNWGEGGVEHK